MFVKKRYSFQTLKTTLQVDNMSEMSEASGQSQLTTQTRPQLMSMGFYKVNLGTKYVFFPSGAL